MGERPERRRAMIPPSVKTIAYRASIIELVDQLNPALAITLAFNRDTSPADAIRKTRLFHAMLDRAALGTFWLKRADERSSYIAVIEHAEKNLHVHLALTCGDKHLACVEAAATAAWRKLVPGGSVDIQPAYDVSGWGRYLSKEITPQTSDHLFLSETASRPT
ncbi:hypothetical protein [Brevundimonas sp.]